MAVADSALTARAAPGGALTALAALGSALAARAAPGSVPTTWPPLVAPLLHGRRW
jgi:hypothetical protein